MEKYYSEFFFKNKDYFRFSGICGRLLFCSFSFSESMTDWTSLISSCEIETSAMLVAIKKKASIDVNLVRKSPAVLEVVKLSCETPRPNAPPSDL